MQTKHTLRDSKWLMVLGSFSEKTSEREIQVSKRSVPIELWKFTFEIPIVRQIKLLKIG